MAFALELKSGLSNSKWFDCQLNQILFSKAELSALSLKTNIKTLDSFLFRG